MPRKSLTIRLDKPLLRRLRRVAREDGRSVSDTAATLLRRTLDASSPPPARVRPTMGRFSHLDAPDNLADFRDVRRSLARSLIRRMSRHHGCAE